MLFDIFSNFDDQNKVMFSFSLLCWTLPMIIVGMILKTKPLMSNQTTLVLLINKISQELMKTTQLKKIGGTMSFLISLIYLIIMMNMLGMTPYIFSLTSHLAINLSIALPLWLSLTLMSASFNTSSFLAHFQPVGAPIILNPFLCLIELLSMLIRPITLAVRLTANMTAGHILIGLMGLAFSNSSLMLSLMIIMLGLFYFLFEMAICLIQAYIFSSLSALYMDEHPS